jgi:hypothetical protein
MRKNIKNEFEVTKDELNKKIIHTIADCAVCKQKGVRFVNVGESEEEFVCTTCGCKTSFGKEKFVINRFGYYFFKK